jgi:hypothetical protein
MQATVVETPTYLARASKIMSAAEMNSIVNFVSAAPESGDIIKGCAKPVWHLAVVGKAAVQE